MRVHLVYAHPSGASFAAAIKDRVVRVLTSLGHEVDVLDLYAVGFDPVLSAAAWSDNLSHPANTVGVAAEAARLSEAEALVLCFPTWWYGMPAILKGWFDRVWVAGVAFHLDPKGGPIRRGLTNIRRFAVVTTYGAPWWFITFSVGDPGRKVLLRGLARLVAPDAAKTFLAAYALDQAARPKLERFLNRVERRLRQRF